MNKNIILLISALIVSLAIGEVSMRVFDISPQTKIPKGLYENHETIGYKLSPDFNGFTVSTDGKHTFITTNSLGIWEDSDFIMELNPILILGDSYTYGAFCCDLDDTYPKVVQRVTRIPTLNAGVCGYSTRDELEFLKAFADQIKPRLVVITFYVGNDIYSNALPYDEYTVVDEQLSLVSNESRAKRWIRRNSAFYRVVTSFIMPNKNYDYHYNLHNNIDMEEVEITESLFIDYKNYCDEKNISCIVYIIPDRFQFSNNSFFYQEHFADFFRRINLTYYDATDEFMRHDIDSLYLKKDGHWSEYGCEVVGEYLGERLK